MKRKMRSKLLIIVLFVMLGLTVIPIITKGTTNSAPTITFKQMGGEVLKQSNSYITNYNPNGYGTVDVTATDLDGDGIAYFKYTWDYHRIKPNPTILTYQEMKSTRTVGIKVPQTEGLHILRICAIDQTGKQSAWKNIPYYIVNELSKTADTTAPLFDQSNPNELPRSNSEVELGKKITVRASDLESGVYYIAYAWKRTGEGSPSGSEYTRVFQPLDDKINFNAPNERGNWTLWIFAANSTYIQEKNQFMMSNLYFFNYTIVDKIAPTVLLNGDSKIEVPENGEYKDLGATVTDNYDEGRTIYSENKVDTSKRGTYTLTYKTTDSSGNESNTVTRTVIVVGDKEITNLTLPNKKEYQFGEEIDLTGANIEVISKIGEVSNIPVTKEMLKNFTTQSLGANNATFEYGGETITYAYTVNDYVKEVILVPPTKTTYDYNEPLDLTGATVQKVMASGVNTLVENITNEMLVNEYRPTLMGKQTIRVSYAGKEVSFEVQVTDLTAPVITLNGEEEVNIQIGQPYVEQNATAQDNYDGEVQVIITSNNVNVAKVGDYEVTYQAVDSYGNIATKVRKVHIFDATIPEIKVNSDLEIRIVLGQEFTIPTATATDEYDGDLSDKIVVTGTVDNSKIGTYEIQYNVTDSCGNKAPEVTVKVIVEDKTAPTITLEGDNPQILELKEEYTELGATVSDNYDKAEEITITIDATQVNTQVAGEYKVLYTATDKSGNIATIERTVLVLNKDSLHETTDKIKELEQNDYTEDSWKDLEDATKLPENSEQEVNDKKDAIENAINNLVPKTLDTKEFEAVKVEIRKLVETDYEADSWKTLKNKLKEAYAQNLQSKLDEKVNELKQTIKDLVAKEVNQEGLTSIENALKDLVQTDYTEESWSKVTAAIEATKQIKDLQSKFDTALENIKLDEMLEAKPVDKTTLDAIKKELEKLNPDDYTEASWKAIQDQITVAESQILQSKFNEEVAKIKLDTLVLLPVVSNIQITTNNENIKYAKVEDIITIAFESNVELDLSKTVVTLNSTPITVSKVENEEKYLYQASFTMNDRCVEGNVRYTIKPEGIAENVGQEVAGKTGITFDKTAPVINFADGIGDKTLEVKTEYEIGNSDIVISDNYTTVEDLAININNTLDINTVNSYEITYTVKDLAGNETSIKRTITVQDTTAPVITLNGENPVVLEKGQDYTDEGATATDIYDGDLTDKIVVNNPVDVNTANEYTITYDVTDNNGNQAAQVTRTVLVLNKDSLHETTDKIKDLEQTDYTEDSWKNLEDATKLPENSEQEVNDKKDAIENAINNLSPKTLNTTEFEAVKVEIRKLVQTDYTEETWNNLKKVLEEAKAQNLQSKLNEKVAELTKAIQDLVAKEVNQEGLTSIENALKDLVQTDYTEESWKEVNDAIEATKQITDLQSKFDTALENIKLDEMLEAKPVDKTALDAIKKELEKLNPDDYTQTTWKAIQDQITVAESQTLQSKFNEEVAKIKLDTLVLLPVVNNIQTTTSNENIKYAKLGDTISITFESNVELDLTKTVVKLNGRTAVVTKTGENSYTASHIGAEIDAEREISYQIEPVGVLENAGSKITGKTGITFDKTAPAIHFADGVGDKTVPYGTDYKPTKADVVVTDVNETTVEILTSYASDILGEHSVSYQAKDGAGNVSTIIARNITVEDYATGIEIMNPTKVVYNQGETLDLTGGMVQFVMASGIAGNTVAMEESMISGFDSTNPGKQTLTVSYNGFEASFEITILDSTKPTIILNGNAEVTVEVGTGYVEEGAEVRDNIDMGLMPEITGEVNTDQLGTYKIHYNAVDTAGNKADEVIRTVKVVDTQKPILALVGDNPQYIEAGNDYVELGATAMDNYDGDVTNKIRANSSEVNTAVPGEYEVRYIVSDSSKNPSKVEKRIVIVQDTTAPVVTLNGDSKITLEVGSNYEEKGVTIQDNVDKNLTPTILGTVDTTTVGSYTLTYQVMDSHNNVAEPLIRTIEVVDTTKPVITLNGEKEITLNVLEDTYTELGATATDNYDKDIANNIKIEGTVDTSKIGTYTITYKVIDSNGNEAETVTRTVNVIDQVAPVVSLNGDASIDIIAGEKFDDPKVSVTDNYDQECEIFVEGEFNPNAEGNYTLTYYAKDSSGNKSNEVTRDIHVQAVPPVISFGTGEDKTELTEGTVFRKDTEITFDKGTATLTNQTTGEVIENFKGGTLTDGEYTIVATDVSGSKNTINFVVDSTPPVVHFRSGFYGESATIEFEDVHDVHSALLVSGEGVTEIKNQYDNGITINKKGAYSLFVFDKYGNYTRLDFEIQ